MISCAVSLDAHVSCLGCPVLAAFPAAAQGRFQIWACRRAASRVLCSRLAMVMGPTPPGTGVIADATSDTCTRHPCLAPATPAQLLLRLVSSSASLGHLPRAIENCGSRTESDQRQHERKEEQT